MSISSLLNKNIKFAVYATGAGAGFQNKIWKVPGCSSIFAGAGFPYDPSNTASVLGYMPDKFVSVDVAIGLACKAYRQAYKSDKDNKDTNFIGIGLTASVASTRIHRGDHRIILAGISNNKCIICSVLLHKGAGIQDRMNDGDVADILLLNMLHKLSGSNQEINIELLYDIKSIEYLYDDADSLKLFRNYILERNYYKSNGSVDTFVEKDIHQSLLYPGTFNPLHEGHTSFAKSGELTAIEYNGNSCNFQTVYTICIDPPHKEPLSVSEMLQKIENMNGHNFMLTSGDPLFIDKAKNFPRSYFLIGADTLERMLDKRWGVPVKDILEGFKKYQATFFVRGRVDENGNFITMEDVLNKIPDMNNIYKYMFVHVGGRFDMSSTELRQL